jgi:hypothetical protein
MNKEANFNEFISKEFMPEYAQATGQSLGFKRVGNPFPDAIFVMGAERREVGAEFVSVVFPFINQEQRDYRKYQSAFYGVLKKGRPRYKDYLILLQWNSTLIQGERPIRLPDIAKRKGRLLIEEFGDLFSKHFEFLLPYGKLLDPVTEGLGSDLPTLGQYFGAVILNPIGEGYPGRPHADDPCIDFPITWYDSQQIVKAVSRAIETKSNKGREYKTDILLLHDFPKSEGEQHSSNSVGFHAEEITELGSTTLGEMPDFCRRFREIWFLNCCYAEDRTRLYRLK